MQKILGMLLVALITIGLTACSALNFNDSSGPKITSGITAKLDKSGKVDISGTEFPAGEEVHLLFTTDDGVQSNIGYALDPQPVAGKDGAWTSTWSYGRFVKKKLVKEGSYVIVAVDDDYNSIAQESIKFTME